MEANIYEVFLGIQGEGVWLGKRQLFIRFCGCNIRCEFCDTRFAQSPVKVCRLFEEEEENPISVDTLISAIREKRPTFHSISLTGGEPLLSLGFIKELLQRKSWPVYLDTNGTLPHLFRDISRYIDMVACDIKIPSATKDREFWNEHREFLKLCRDCFVKMVVTEDTEMCEIEYAASLIKNVDPNIVTIIQPAHFSIPIHILLSFQEIALSFLTDVRIIPQVHKAMGWR
jgi:organic radical activating enzyme